MNEILVIPDIHGRKFWESALNYKGEIVFLGDYTDPYENENITQKDAYQALQRIVQFKQENPERITLLIGNHEMHYINSDYRVARFSETYYKRYHEILTNEKTADLFQIAKQVGDYLFVHAGVLKGWHDRYETELNAIGGNFATKLNHFFKQREEAFDEIPEERGGIYPYGSPIWAAINELSYEIEPFSGNIIQIVGHNKIKTEEPLFRNNIWFTDNQQLYLLKNSKLERYLKIKSPRTSLGLFILIFVSEIILQPLQLQQPLNQQPLQQFLLLLL